MSDYAKTTNFAVKDALATGDPLKVVKGTEIDVEFTAIQTAGLTKANTASPTFTGVPAAPTAAAGTSTTQVATTAFATENVNAARGYISGLIQSNGPVDLVNDIQLSAGAAIDAGNTNIMNLPAGIIKQLDAAWAVGTNSGGLDTGAIANADYYIWLIKRPDTGVVDALFSLSSTAPTMPANYTLKRLVGWIKRLAAAITIFTAYEESGGGLEVKWTTFATADLFLTNTLTTARRTDAIRVPLNFSVIADIAVSFADAVANNFAMVICPDVADIVVAPGGWPNANLTNPIASVTDNRQMRIRTSATGTIAARATVATVDTYAVSTLGFSWARKN